MNDRLRELDRQFEREVARGIATNLDRLILGDHEHRCKSGNMECALRGYCECKCGMVNHSTNTVRLEWELPKPPEEA